MAETPQKQVHLVQCLNGHTHEVKPRTELEQKCKERLANGFLDALCLSIEECPHCVEDVRERGRRNESMCSNCGCAMMDPCEGVCKMASDIADSPYQEQIGRFIGSSFDQIMDDEIHEMMLAHSWDA